MSLTDVNDINYYIIQFCDYRSISNLLLLNHESHYFIKNLHFYRKLSEIKNPNQKRKGIFEKGYLDAIKLLFKEPNGISKLLHIACLTS